MPKFFESRTFFSSVGVILLHILTAINAAKQLRLHFHNVNGVTNMRKYFKGEFCAMKRRGMVICT